MYTYKGGPGTPREVRQGVGTIHVIIKGQIRLGCEEKVIDF